MEAPENDPIDEPPARSQEQINRFIDYVFNQSMSVSKASRRLKMDSDKAFYYYHLYMNDPEKKIPLLVAPESTRVNTQEEVNTLIRPIVDENVSVLKAAVKVNMTRHTARYYHRRYLADPTHNIPSPYAPLQYPQEKVDEVLGYLVDEKMTPQLQQRQMCLRQLPESIFESISKKTTCMRLNQSMSPSRRTKYRD